MEVKQEEQPPIGNKPVPKKETKDNTNEITKELDNVLYKNKILTDEVDYLRLKNQRLKSENEELKQTKKIITSLQGQVATLTEENKKLKLENSKLVSEKMQSQSYFYSKRWDHLLLERHLSKIKEFSECASSNTQSVREVKTKIKSIIQELQSKLDSLEVAGKTCSNC